MEAEFEREVSKVGRDAALRADHEGGVLRKRASDGFVDRLRRQRKRD